MHDPTLGALGCGQRPRAAWSLSRNWLLACAVLVTALPIPAQALIIGGGTPTTDSPHNTDGTDIAGFNYVGRNTWNGVYLGNGYVLTAEHVGAGNIDFGSGGAYNMVTGSATHLLNPTVASDPTGSGQPTDLSLYRIAPNSSGQLPGMAPLYLPTASTSTGTAVTLVSEGPWVARPSYWTVNQSTDPWTWTPATSSTGNEAGYDYSSYSPYFMGVKRWGSNTISNNLVYTIDINGTYNYVHGLQFGFYNFGTTAGAANVAALANGDSGGGMFTTNANGMTILSGILEAKFTASGQPAFTVSYGTGLLSSTPANNFDYSAAIDIAWYASEIATQMNLSQWTSVATSGNWSDKNWNKFLNTIGRAGANQVGALVNLLAVNSAATTITLDTSATVGMLNFSSPNSYTISSINSNALTFNNGGSGATLADWQGNHTINAAIVMAENLSVNVVTAGSTLSLQQPIGGSGFGITKTGSGSLVLSAVNTYTGGSTVNGGTLTVTAAGSLATGLITIASGATATINGGLGNGSNITNSGTFSLAGAGTLGSLTNNGAANFLGTVSLGSITDNGSGTINFSGNARVGIMYNYSSSGAISFTGATANVAEFTGVGCTTILGNTILTIGSDNATANYTGSIMQQAGTSASLVKMGTGQQNLSGSNGYTGSTTVNAGLLYLPASATFSSSSIVVAAGASIEIDCAYSGGGLNNSGMFSQLSSANVGAVVNTGTMSMGGNVTTGAVVNSGTLRMTGATYNLSSLGGSGAVNLGNTALQIGFDGNNSMITGSISQYGATSGSVTKNGAGTLTLNAANSYVGGTTVNGGTLLLSTSAALPAAGSLTLNGGGVQLAAAAPIPAGQSSNVLIVPQLAFQGAVTGSGSMVPTAQLDLTNNDALVHGGYTLPEVRSLLQAGYHNGTWNGNGITASTTASYAGQGLAYTTGAVWLALHPGSQFAGQNVNSNDILIKYTWQGDTTLKGYIDATDFAQLDAAYLKHIYNGGITQATWFQGDFNYDGMIDANDFAILDAAYTASKGGGLLANNPFYLANLATFGATVNYAGLVTSYLAANVTPVPEPATLALAGLGAVLLLFSKGSRRQR